MKNKNTPSWFKSRNYLHFDNAIKSTTAEKIATNSKKVKSHSFYPFISYSNVTEKLYKDSGTGKIKFKEKIRPISYASHVDASIYSYYSFLLSEPYEKYLENNELQKNITAFRSLGKSNIDFAHDIFSEIRSRKFCSAIALDITGFFDNLDHQYLKNMWSKVMSVEVLPPDHYAVFKSLTIFSKVDRDLLYKEMGISKNNPKKLNSRVCTPFEFRNRVRGKGLIEKNTNKYGIPQGSPISAMLSNIYMLDFDKAMSQYLNKLGGSYYRYCDDMIILVHPESRDSVIEFAMSEIEELQLSINEDKTEVANFSISAGKQKSDRNLQYLGFTFDGERILLRSAALARYSAKMKAGIKLAKLTRDKYNEIRNEKGLPKKALYKRKIYERYSHLGKQNFLTYGYRSAIKMDSKNIRKQLKPLWGRLIKEIEK